METYGNGDGSLGRKRDIVDKGHSPSKEMKEAQEESKRLLLGNPESPDMTKSQSGRKVSEINDDIQQGIIELDDKEVQLPTEISLEKFKHHKKLDHVLRTIIGTLNNKDLISGRNSQVLKVLFKTLEEKLVFYSQKRNYNDNDSFKFIEKWTNHLENVNSFLKSNSDESDISTFMERTTLIIFGSPELSDEVIIDQYLQVDMGERHKIYSHNAAFEKLSQLCQKESGITNALKAAKWITLQTGFYYSPTQTPCIAAFMKGLGINVRTEEHSITKPLRRFDKFNEKFQDFYLHLYSAMCSEDTKIPFDELPEFFAVDILRLSSQITRYLANAGWIIEKCEFSYLTKIFDEKITDFLNCLKDKIKPGNRRDIGVSVIKWALDLPLLVEHELKGKENTKQNISVFFATIKREFAKAVITSLDQHILNLDSFFVRNGSLLVPHADDGQDASQVDGESVASTSTQHAFTGSVNTWESELSGFLKKLDSYVELVEKPEAPTSVIFSTKLAYRMEIVGGMDNLHLTLLARLGIIQKTFLFDAVYREVVQSVGRHFRTAIEDGNPLDKAIQSSMVTTEAQLDQLVRKGEDTVASIIVKCLQSCVDETRKTAISDQNASRLQRREITAGGDRQLLEAAGLGGAASQGKTLKERLDRAVKLLTLINSTGQTQSGAMVVANQAALSETEGSEPQAVIARNRQDIHEMDEKSVDELLGLKRKPPSTRPPGSLLTGLARVADSMHTLYETCFIGWPSFSMEAKYLKPAENLRTKDLVVMRTSHHENAKILCQCALQKAWLNIQESINNEDHRTSIDTMFARFIKDTDSYTTIDSIDVFGFCKQIINNIALLDNQKFINEDYSDLTGTLASCYKRQKQRCDSFLKNNYLKQNERAWNTTLSTMEEENESTFHGVIEQFVDRISQDKRDMILKVITSLVEEFTEVFKQPLRQYPLPPSLEMVAFYQQLMPLRLSSHDQLGGDVDDYRLAVETFNIYLKSYGENFSYAVTVREDATRTLLNNLESTATKTEAALLDPMVRSLFKQVERLDSDPEGSKKLNEFNDAVANFLKQNPLEKGGGAIVSVFRKVQGLCDRFEGAIAGMFVGCAAINMYFTQIATDLMRGLQEHAQPLFAALYRLKEALDALGDYVPGLRDLLNTTYTAGLEANANSTAVSNCSAAIYQNMEAGVTNTTAVALLEQAGEHSISILESLNYEDAQGCPSGGLDSFPTNSYVNYGNLFTTVVSIFTGFLACWTGWMRDVSNFVEDSKSFSSLSNAYQELSPEACEKLLEMTAKRLPSGAEGGIYHATSMQEKMLDKMEAIFHKNVQLKSRTAFLAVNTLVGSLRYVLLSPASHAVAPRPHSHNEMLQTLAIDAKHRTIKTLIRMLGYNSLKEFMDVFSTKAGTLAMLIFVKELDIHIAATEKAALSRYLTMKSMLGKFMSVRLSKPVKLDKSEVSMLKSVYGQEIVDNLIGRDKASIANIEKEAQAFISRMGNRLTGLALILGAYGGYAFNIFAYTVTPALQAQGALAAASMSSPLEDEEMSKVILEKAMKTLRREYQPTDLSDDDLYWHYFSAARGITKYEASAVHWGIKEAINASIWFNTTAHERGMYLNSTNWEALAATGAYLIKDSTGMAARLGALMESETVRTGGSFIDKVDSPLAEKLHPLVGKRGITSPQQVLNAVDDMIEDAVTHSGGNIREVQASLQSLTHGLSSLGLVNLEICTQIQEEHVQAALLELANEQAQAPEDQGASRSELASQQSGHYQALQLALYRKLSSKIASYGKPIDPQTRQKLKALDGQLEVFRAPGFDCTQPAMMVTAMTRLEEIMPPELADAWITTTVLKQIRVRSAVETAQKRIQDLEHTQARRDAQSEEVPPVIETVAEEVPQVIEMVEEEVPQVMETVV